VSTLSLIRPARTGSPSRFLPRRLRRLPISCESLELRQVLSAGQLGTAANLLTSQAVAQPSIQSAPLSSSGVPTGLSPSQIRAAYGVNQINFGSVSGNGAGQTIAIIDSYFDSNISSDLKQFDSQYGLAAPPSFTQYVENGLQSNNSGWALETALDVEWAHAIAPGANIVLVEAQPDVNDLVSAASFAAGLPGVSVVSMSWGSGEFPGETAYDGAFTTPAGHNGVTFVASSGDSATTEYPSASPNVLAVGGTTLNLTSTGAYGSESSWSGSGSGSSAFESAPSWQTNGLNSSARTTPDVAWDANPATGVSVYDSVAVGGKSGWFTVGGTSVGAPSWAGLIAITDQGLALHGVGSLSNAQADLYQLSTTTFNQPSSNSSGSSSATAAYSLTTGLGSPKANLLVPALVQLNTPASATATTSPIATTKTTTSPVVGRMSILSPSPTDPTSTGSTSGSSTISNSPTGTSITALNPSVTSTTTTQTVAPVVLVPVPLPPVVLHLNASASPVIAQAMDAALAAQGELPTSLTLFGQGLETELQKQFKTELGPRFEAPWFIDVVEPFQPVAPAQSPKTQPAPEASRAWPSPSVSDRGIDALLEMADRGPLSSALDGSSLKNRRNAKTPSWGFSAIIGTALIAAGGYHLALHDEGRSKGSSMPLRTRGSHPSRRVPRFPER
jgi:hypothetical protein